MTGSIQGFLLRKMVQEDCIEIAKLHAELDHGGWGLSQWQQVLVEYPFSWVLQEKEQAIGYICYQTKIPQVELLNLGVCRLHQGRGLGAELLSTTLQLLPENTEAVYLEVRRSNIPAIGLYQNLGFQKIGERPEYYSVAGGSKEDALIYKYKPPIAEC